MFVDDLFLFGNGSVAEVKEYCNILKLFCEAKGIEIKLRESSIRINTVTQAHKDMILQYLLYSVHIFKGSLVYLGFNLKPLNCTLDSSMDSYGRLSNPCKEYTKRNPCILALAWVHP